jgi:hypothetical protein
VSVLEIMENRGRQGQINLNGKQRFCQHWLALQGWMETGAEIATAADL